MHTRTCTRTRTRTYTHTKKHTHAHTEVSRQRKTRTHSILLVLCSLIHVCVCLSLLSLSHTHTRTHTHTHTATRQTHTQTDSNLPVLVDPCPSPTRLPAGVQPVGPVRKLRRLGPAPGVAMPTRVRDRSTRGRLRLRRRLHGTHTTMCAFCGYFSVKRVQKALHEAPEADKTRM